MIDKQISIWCASVKRQASRLDSGAMLRDTLAALDQLPNALTRFRQNLPQHAHSPLPTLELSVRTTLDPGEAYNMVPERDPQKG
jgi:hypothetical protein